MAGHKDKQEGLQSAANMKAKRDDRHRTPSVRGEPATRRGHGSLGHHPLPKKAQQVERQDQRCERTG